MTPAAKSTRMTSIDRSGRTAVALMSRTATPGLSRVLRSGRAIVLPMRTPLRVVVMLLLAPLGCSQAVGRPSTDGSPGVPDGKAITRPPFAKQSPVDGGPVRAPTGGRRQVDGGLPQIQPFTEGKRVGITKLVRSPPLELTVPGDMRVTMVDDSNDLLPHALLKGQDGAVVIENPESPWDGLTAYLTTRSLDASEVIHTQPLGRGFLGIARARLASSPTGYRYFITVSRPDLGVECGEDVTSRVTNLARAEKIASICLSLGAREGK